MAARHEVSLAEAFAVVAPETAIEEFLLPIAGVDGLVARLHENGSDAHLAPSSDSNASIEFGRTWLRCAVDRASGMAYVADHPGTFRVHEANSQTHSLEVKASQLQDDRTRAAVVSLVALANTHRLHGAVIGDRVSAGEAAGHAQRVGGVCPEHHMKRDLRGGCPMCD